MRGSSLSRNGKSSFAGVLAVLGLFRAKLDTLGLKAPSDKVFAKHFDVPTRKVTDAEGQKALGELNLLTESGDALSWDKTSGSDGNYNLLVSI